MREILFRGKRIDNGEWVYGGYYKEDYTDYVYITFWNSFGLGFMDSCRVDPSTVGQYTGLTDKNGKRIFEGDIITAQDDICGSPFCDGITGKVVFDEAAFFLEPKDPMDSQWLFNECAVYEVIGNIHDNPELLKEG